jgi:VWFA-related protein
MLTASIALLLLVPQVAQSGAPFGETLHVEVVEVDVVVTDRKGVVVPNLTRDDFTVLVAGKPVELTNFAAYFEEVAGTGITATAGELSQAEESSPKSRPAVADPPPSVTWLVYVDLHRSDRFQRWAALKQLGDFLEKSRRESDRMMVATFDGDALKILQPLTRDAAAVKRALRPLEMQNPSREFAMVNPAVDLAGAALGGFPDPEREMFRPEQVRRLRSALSAFQDLVAIVQGLEGRVALLFVGGGFKLSIEPDPARAAVLHHEYQCLLQQLSAGRITVYSVYAGSERFPGDLGVSESAGREQRRVGDENFDSFGVIDVAAEMFAFADETGGIPLVAGQGLDRRLELVRRDLDGYYSLGFRPPPGSAGKHLAIEVRVNRPALQARHRRAVHLRSDAELASGAALAALLDNAQAENRWGVRVHLGSLRRSHRGTYRTQVEVRVPLEQVVVLERNGAHRGKLTFHFAARDPQGRYRRLATRELPFALSDVELTSMRKEGIRYRVDVVVPGGSTDLSVTVSDALSGSHATVRRSIETPARGPLPEPY